MPEGFEKTLKDVIPEQAASCDESPGRQAFNYALVFKTTEPRQCLNGGKCAESLSAHAVSINALAEVLNALCSQDFVLPTTL